MKIASWNVNSLKVRLPHVLDWIKSEKPDLLGLQETKTIDENFPVEEIQDAGYQVLYSGQKTYNGVAILSKMDTEPSDIITDIPGLDDPQRRVMGATYGDLRFINLYVPNGYEVDSVKYRYKLDWLEKINTYIKQQLDQYKKLVMVDNFKIAPEDNQVHDPEEWEGSILVSKPERDAYQSLLKLGLKDTFRLTEQDEKLYRWGDYRAAAFRRNRGARIDLILASHDMADHCKDSRIDKEPRKLERPSDHAPVIEEF